MSIFDISYKFAGVPPQLYLNPNTFKDFSASLQDSYNKLVKPPSAEEIGVQRAIEGSFSDPLGKKVEGSSPQTGGEGNNNLKQGFDVSDIFKGTSDVMGAIAPLAKSLNSENRETAFDTQQQVGNVLTTLDPTVGLIYKGLSAISEATGTNSSLMSNSDAKAIGMSGFGRIANNALGIIPFAGAFGANKTAFKSDAVDRLSGGFGGTASKINQGLSIGNQKYAFGIGQDAANSFISQNNVDNDKLAAIDRVNTLRAQNTSGENHQSQYINRITNTNRSITSAKMGIKFLNKAELSRIYSKKLGGTLKFQDGGSILIPDGELHARRHHMEDVNPELAEDLTKKGIPVIVTDENSEVSQVAEIEKNEIILEKNLTDKIEELRKEGTEEAMIEAGKLIVDTLFNNCDDNTNLVKEVE